MANGGLLQSIINPAQADVLGSLDKGRERQATDLAGEILGQTLGGKIGALAQLSPEKGLELAKFFGTSGKGRTDKMVGNAIIASQLIEAGQFDEAAAIFDEDIQTLGGLGIDVSRSTATRDGILNRDPNVINPLVAFGNAVDPTKKAAGGLASAKTEILGDGTTIQAMPDGSTQVTNPLGNVVTGQERLDVLKSSRKSRISTLQAEADINVAEAQSKAIATQRASRISAITKEQSDRNRGAARGQINLNQAAKLIERASQGAAGASKVALAKVFPGIDVTDEAALSQSLTLLALDELQKFKGPTTDFEFAKTEQISGKLGDSKAANRAKVASLQRNNWFIRRESQQFNEWIKAGKNPDTFGFDFGERVTTKRGDFSLQDLQDTALENNLTIEETIKRLNK